ncbi:DJ-1/PfpI family protein [Pseudoduganella sp. RAF53_2]|uniref:DJ-1/PfpI family protein n=1 Tax=unclassified Pseudoduganella TaxID=2637179 RepID=UPI003F9A47DB
MYRLNEKSISGLFCLSLLLTTLHPVLAAESDFAGAQASLGGVSQSKDGKIDRYQARFGRPRPVVAVIGENSAPDSTTEITDFVIPYAVLTQAGVAETIALATHTGPLKMRRALQIQPHATITQFDERYPEGADYVIVPAVTKFTNPDLLKWIQSQATKGSSIVSICDGALVVAESGLMKGRRATAHWDTEELRFSKYTDIKWQKNVRYVADGKIISSAGISAALPTSIALVEAIAGRDRAEFVAKSLGVTEWGTKHNSEVFLPKLGVNMVAFITYRYTNAWLYQTDSIGVPISAGIDDIALAFTADAYSRTGRSQAYSVADNKAVVRTRNGLLIIPDSTTLTGGIDFTLPSLQPFEEGAGSRALDDALIGISDKYGRKTAAGVALQFEYPGFAQ